MRIRYGRGRVRFLKWVLDPIAALGVYLLLVALVLDRGGDAIGLSLACAIVPFQLMITSVAQRARGGAPARLDHRQHGVPADADPGVLIPRSGFSRAKGAVAACCTRST